MNLSDRLLLIFFLAFEFNILLIAQVDSCEASIIIQCDIPNVILSFNGNQFEQADHFNLKLKRGRYKITLLENSDRLDAKTIFDTIVIDSCAEKLFQYYFREEVYLDTKPQDAKVISNDSLIGYTPLLIKKRLSPFIISKEDYEPLLISAEKLEKNNIFQLDFIGVEKKKFFFETIEFKIILGTAAILGAVTAYYKLLADDTFDEYKITGDQNSLNLTRKYDLISGISFGLLQIDFGYLLYNVFIE